MIQRKTYDELRDRLAEIEDEITEERNEYMEWQDKYDSLNDLKYTPRDLEEAWSIMWETIYFDYATEEILLDWVKQKAEEWELSQIILQLSDLNSWEDWYEIDWYGNFTNPTSYCEDEIEWYKDEVTDKMNLYQWRVDELMEEKEQIEQILNANDDEEWKTIEQ